MDDLISRQAVLDALNNIEIPRNALWYQYYQQALTAVDKLPPAPPERIKGRWIPSDTDGFVCSVCRNGYRNQPTLMGKPMFEFCPVCGAEMEVTT